MSSQSENVKDKDGFLLLHKKNGPTSHDMVKDVRRLFKMRKVGHGGTLDPLAEGLLILGLGRATKKLTQLINDDKVYRVQCLLGIKTDSYDVTGKVLEEKDATRLLESDIVSVLKGFVGSQKQIPPMFSAKKMKGKPLYYYARRGQCLEREAKDINIHRLDILSIKGVCIDFEVHCSKGTYIRTLCHDIGEKLGVGAMMKALVRTDIGSFSVKDAISIDQLEHCDFENRKDFLVPLTVIQKKYEAR